jgi:AcrR family transcriptional regulator
MPTLTEQARRAQIIAVAIDQVAARGYADCSLQRIAEAAGITKGAVIYHFASKNAVIRAAYESVIAALTERVGTAVQAAADPGAAVDAYVQAMVGQMDDNPAHVRMIVEALGAAQATGIEDRPDSPERWRALAGLITAAVQAGQYRADLDAESLSVLLTGAIDAAVAQRMSDPGFDLEASTAVLLDMLHRTARR